MFSVSITERAVRKEILNVFLLKHPLFLHWSWIITIIILLIIHISCELFEWRDETEALFALSESAFSNWSLRRTRKRRYKWKWNIRSNFACVFYCSCYWFDISWITFFKATRTIYKYHKIKEQCPVVTNGDIKINGTCWYGRSCWVSVWPSSYVLQRNFILFLFFRRDKIWLYSPFFASLATLKLYRNTNSCNTDWIENPFSSIVIVSLCNTPYEYDLTLFIVESRKVFQDSRNFFLRQKQSY